MMMDPLTDSAEIAPELFMMRMEPDTASTLTRPSAPSISTSPFTEDAVTDAGYIWFTLTALVIVYAAMTVGAYKLLRSMSRRWREGEKDLASPYGPSELAKGPVG